MSDMRWRGRGRESPDANIRLVPLPHTPHKVLAQSKWMKDELWEDHKGCGGDEYEGWGWESWWEIG